MKNDIVAGVYPAGGRIPSEQVLCDTYGVSRVTVRKAMLDLVQEGLLVRRQGKGTFVEMCIRDSSKIVRCIMTYPIQARKRGNKPS